MLAIVIPYYKLTFFEETLQSLSNQTDKRFKVYIGDDSSPESPDDLLDKYQGKFDFVDKRFNENLGGTSLTQQWDRCIALSGDEEWLMILGDDDVLGESLVEQFYKHLVEINNNGCRVVKFASQTNDYKKNCLSKVYCNPKLEHAASFYFKRFKGEKRSSVSEHIFCRDTYVKHGFKNYPLGWHTDDYAWLLFAGETPLYCINEAVVEISVSSQSISGDHNNLIFKNIAEAEFYTDVIKTMLHLFKKSERLELLYQAEVSVKKNRKLTQAEWKYVAMCYFQNFSAVPTFKFIRRYLIHFVE